MPRGLAAAAPDPAGWPRPASRRLRRSSCPAAASRPARGTPRGTWNSPGLPLSTPSRAKRRPLSCAADRPAGNGLREGGDVGLRVAAVDAQRVQLEDFARQVFVDVHLAARCRAVPTNFAAREFGPIEAWLSRYSSIAGCFSTANNRSVKLPVTCGRMASRSIAPARPSTAILSMDTAKWLVQNCVSRSRNGRSVVTACEKRAIRFVDVHRPVDGRQLERGGDLAASSSSFLLSRAASSTTSLRSSMTSRQRFGGRLESLAGQAPGGEPLSCLTQPVLRDRCHARQLARAGRRARSGWRRWPRPVSFSRRSHGLPASTHCGCR